MRRPREGLVMHLPIAFLALWQWGQEGTGPVAGRVAAGESRGPVLRRGCHSAVCWGGDAQPCVQFPTGLAIRHRRCELPGMTYFSCARAALARRGSRLPRPLPGGVTHCSAREPVGGSWHSVTPWRPSPGVWVASWAASLLHPAGQTSASQAPVGGEVLETKIPSCGNPGATGIGVGGLGKGFWCCPFHLYPAGG